MTEAGSGSKPTSGGSAPSSSSARSCRSSTRRSSTSRSTRSAATCTRSIGQIQWVVTGYMLALAAVIPVSGWAARRFGAKRLYLISLVLFTLGSVLCGSRPARPSSHRLPRAPGRRRRNDHAARPDDHGAAPPGRKRMGRVMSIVAVPAMLAPILGPTLGGVHPRDARLALDLLRQRPDRRVAVIASLRMLPRAEPGRAGRRSTSAASRCMVTGRRRSSPTGSRRSARPAPSARCGWSSRPRRARADRAVRGARAARAAAAAQPSAVQAADVLDGVDRDVPARRGAVRRR